jgi:hypothetical protein
LQPPTTPEPYADQLETLNMASQRFLNTSITFVGVLSEIGTTVPRMIRRATLARTEREEIMDFKVLGAELDFRSKPEALKAVLSQVRRPELSTYWQSLTTPDKHEGSNPNDWPRFHSKES